ncbi:CrcB family protein [Actinomycetaceae bacterium L2_0104]
MILFLTALAGGLGGALRFLVDTGVSRFNKSSIPLGTIVINVSACFLLGFLNGFVAHHAGYENLASVVGIGVMGGYSTFSTASVEGVRLIRARRYLVALLHGGGMLVLSFVAALLGLFLASLLP